MGLQQFKNNRQPNNQPVAFSNSTYGGPATIAITSGKGGVGKTLTTVNLAMAARNQGLNVLILDADFGLANVDVVLGLQSRYSIVDVLDGHVALSDIILEGPSGIKVIPSGSGVSRMAHLSQIERLIILEQLQELDFEFDVVLIDTGAGISENVVQMNHASDEVVVVTTPEPHSMTDAYAIIKVMSENGEGDSLNLMVNQAQSLELATKVFERLADVAKRFLNVEINFIGHVPVDPQVARAIAMRKAISESSKHTISGQAWAKVANNLFNRTKYKNNERNLSLIWKKMLWRDHSSETSKL